MRTSSRPPIAPSGLTTVRRKAHLQTGLYGKTGGKQCRQCFKMEARRTETLWQTAANAQLQTSAARGIPACRSRWMRMIFCLLLGLIAVFFAFVGGTMPLMLPSQAAKDRAYYQQFKAAAAYVAKNGQLPASELGGWRNTGDAGPLIQSSLKIPGDCASSFKKAPADSLILSFWRGEWTECYAYPSGRTTLPMSVQAYLLSGLGINLVIYWLLAAGAAWGAIRLRPQRGASVLSPSNGS